MKASKEPYVSPEDRPSAQIDPDTPIAQLRVRDLRVILGLTVLGGGLGKVPHPKFEGWSPLKEFFDKPFPETAIGSAPTSALDQLIQETARLTKKVDQLANQVAEFKKRVKK